MDKRFQVVKVGSDRRRRFLTAAGKWTLSPNAARVFDEKALAVAARPFEVAAVVVSITTADSIRGGDPHAIVAKADGFEFSVLDLHRAFESVQDPSDWKAPIDAVVRLQCAPGIAGQGRHIRARQRVAIVEAVKWFAGCVPTITPAVGAFTTSGGFVRVEADGYRQAVGA